MHNLRRTRHNQRFRLRDLPLPLRRPLGARHTIASFALDHIRLIRLPQHPTRLTPFFRARVARTDSADPDMRVWLALADGADNLCCIATDVGVGTTCTGMRHQQGPM